MFNRYISKNKNNFNNSSSWLPLSLIALTCVALIAAVIYSAFTSLIVFASLVVAIEGFGAITSLYSIFKKSPTNATHAQVLPGNSTLHVTKVQAKLNEHNPQPKAQVEKTIIQPMNAEKAPATLPMTHSLEAENVVPLRRPS